MTNEKPLSRIRHWLLSGVTVLLTLTVGIITGVFAVIVNLATDLIPKSWPIVSNAYLLGGIGLCFIVLTAAIERVRRNLSNSQSGEGTKRSNSETLSAAFIGRDNSGTVIQAAGGTVNYYGSVASNRIPDQNNDDQRSSLSLVATQSRLPRSSAHFVGRDHELKELEKALLGNRGAVVAIHGLGGVGKTQLALKYANNHLGSYKDIWWIPCDSAPLIVEGLSVIGPELGVPKDVEPQLVVDLVLAELCQLNNWLIIYDNAQSLDELNQFIPAQSGNVIVTSRARGFGALGVSLEVRELSRAESVDFFRRRISIEAANGSLNELSRLLGNLPLALAQVAAYIEVTGISVDSYIRLWSEHCPTLLSRGIALGHSETIATVWDITVARLRDEAPGAVQLLELLSLVGPERLPLDLLSLADEWLAPVAPILYRNALGLDDAVGALAKYSMCYRDDLTVSVHRLVQISTQQKLTSDNLSSKLSPLMTALAKMAPDGDKPLWWHVFLGHVLALLENSKRVDFASEDSAWLEREAGEYLAKRGDLESALAICQSAVSTAQRVFGAQSANYALAISGLADAVEHKGEIAKSIEMRRRALAIVESDLGSDHVNAMVLRSELAIALVGVGAIDEARPLLEWYVEWAEGSRDRDPGRLPHAYGCLGTLFYKMGSFQQARECLEKALVLVRATQDPSRSMIAALMNHLSAVLMAEHQYEAAEELARTVRQMNVALYGEKSPLSAVATTNLAALLRHLERNEEALQLAQEAADVLEKSDGSRGPRILSALVNLAAITAAVGDLKRSEVMCSKVQTLDKELYGSQGEISSRVMSNLAVAYLKAGNLQRARTLAARSLRAAETAYERPHIDVARRLGVLGMIQVRLGQITQARRTLKRALAEYNSAEHGGHPEAIDIQKRLSEVS